ncbi:PT domain-containing protein [Streptomyces sp. MK37H]|nr:hypothetical protein [Streptomyces sp. MK37H]
MPSSARPGGQPYVRPGGQPYAGPCGQPYVRPSAEPSAPVPRSCWPRPW